MKNQQNIFPETKTAKTNKKEVWDKSLLLIKIRNKVWKKFNNINCKASEFLIVFQLSN